jgi:hypothetical protein
MRGNPFSEPSATIVWSALYRLQIAEETLLWNARSYILIARGSRGPTGRQHRKRWLSASRPFGS